MQNCSFSACEEVSHFLTQERHLSSRNDASRVCVSIHVWLDEGASLTWGGTWHWLGWRVLSDFQKRSCLLQILVRIYIRLGQAVLSSAGASICPISLQVHRCSHLPPPLSQPSEFLRPSWERKGWLLASQLWSGPLSPHEAINYPTATSLELGESPGPAIPWCLYSKWSSPLSNPVLPTLFSSSFFLW